LAKLGHLEKSVWPLETESTQCKPTGDLEVEFLVLKLLRMAHDLGNEIFVSSTLGALAALKELKAAGKGHQGTIGSMATLGENEKSEMTNSGSPTATSALAVAGIRRSRASTGKNRI